MFCEHCGMQLVEGSKFCPNCGSKVGDETVKATEEIRDNAMSVNGQYYGPYSGPVVQINPGTNIPNQKKKKTAMIAVGAVVAAFLVIGGIAAAAFIFFGGPRTKVLRAVASTMKDTPELVNDLKAVSSILAADYYTAGFELEADEADIKAEFRNAKSDKQIYLSADIDHYGDIDLLCGVHSGTFRASLSDLNYVFIYDPKADNDGFLCEQIRRTQLDEINEILENITSNKAEEFRKNFADAFEAELKELEFRDAKTRRFKIDDKQRECEGYKIRITEKNIIHVLESVGEMSKEYEDLLDDLCDEIRYEEFEMDITFYIYKNKLAAVILAVDDEEEFYIEFRGGEYRMQNIVIGGGYQGDDYEIVTINTRNRNGKEVIEIEGSGYAEISITYDTKSGAITYEYYGGPYSYLISGIYKHSNSEVSFTLKELEYSGHSLMDDIDFTAYVKKKVDIEEYRGKEFDIGSADREKIEELADDLEDYFDLLDDLYYFW